MVWLKIGAGVLLLLPLVWAGLYVWGWMRWDALTRDLRASLEAARRPGAVVLYHPRELEGLPAPVQRYFRTVLNEGQPIVAAATLNHEGEFNLRLEKEQWRNFNSTQRVLTQRPGFDWNGYIVAAPGVPVRVHDAYVAGEGVLQASLLGAVPLADLRGTSEVARGQLMRFLAEAPWYPTALLPSQGVRWEAMGDTSARATLSDAGLSVSVIFYFSEAGFLVGMRAPSRARTVGKALVSTPWVGRFWNYEERRGMRVPLQGEVGWALPEGERVYWRGRLTLLEYEWAHTRKHQAIANSDWQRTSTCKSAGAASVSLRITDAGLK